MLGLGLGLTNFGTRGGVSDVPDALSGASSLLDGEDGLAIAFEDQSIAIRDTTTPANNIASAGTVRNGLLVGPGAKITYTSPSPKLCRKSDGTYAYRAHNLCVSSNNFSTGWDITELNTTGGQGDPYGGSGATACVVKSATTILNALHQVSANTGMVASNQHRIVIRAKALPGTAFPWTEITTTQPTTRSWVNLTTGAVGTVNHVSVTPTSLGDGWWEFVVITPVMTGSSEFYFMPRNANGNSLSVTGDGVSGFYVTRVQYGKFPCAPDYIETTGIPLYDLPYDWTGTYYYPLVEPAATNICLHSNDLTQSNWTKTSATAAKTATGLDGVANSASTLTASAANGVAVQNISSASATRSGSVFLKRRTGTGAVSIAIGETTGSNLVTNGTFDTDITGWTNSVPAAGNISHSSSAVLVERVSGGLSAYQAVTCTVGKLYRLTYAFTSVSGGASRAALTNSTGVIGAGDLTATGGSVFLATASTMYAHLSLNSGNGTSGRYDDVVVQEVVEATVDLSSGAWVRATIENKTITNPCVAIKLATSGDAVDVAYAQMETGSEATSPIITAGATVTRAADQPTIPTSAFPNVQAAITLYAEAIVRGSQSSGRLIQIDDGTSGEAHRFSYNSTDTASFSTTDGGSGQSNIIPATTGALALGATVKAAYAVQANSAQAAVNGTLGAEDTSLTMPTTTTLRLGHANGGGTQLAQHIKRVMVLPRRMSNAELQALTA